MRSNREINPSEEQLILRWESIYLFILSIDALLLAIGSDNNLITSLISLLNLIQS